MSTNAMRHAHPDLSCLHAAESGIKYDAANDCFIKRVEIRTLPDLPSGLRPKDLEAKELTTPFRVLAGTHMGRPLEIEVRRLKWRVKDRELASRIGQRTFTSPLPETLRFGGRSITEDCALLMLERLVHNRTDQVAQDFGRAWSTIDAYQKEVWEALSQLGDLIPWPEIVLADGIYIDGNEGLHLYDPVRSETIAWIESTKRGVFFERLHRKVGWERVKVICCDGDKRLQEFLSEFFPNATVVMDRAHAIRHSLRLLLKKLSDEREAFIEMVPSIRDLGRRNAIRVFNACLFSETRDLTEAARKRLQLLKGASPDFRRIRVLMHGLRRLFRCRDDDAARAFFARWKRLVDKYALSFFDRIVHYFEKNLDALLGHYRTYVMEDGRRKRMTTAAIEATHQYMRKLARDANGLSFGSLQKRYAFRKGWFAGLLKTAYSDWLRRTMGTYEAGPPMSDEPVVDRAVRRQKDSRLRASRRKGGPGGPGCPETRGLGHLVPPWIDERGDGGKPVSKPSKGAGVVLERGRSADVVP